MAYTKNYPSGWKNEPNTSTPVSAAALDHIETGIADAHTIAEGKQSALGFTPENVAKKGAINGYPPLNELGQVPSEYLPAYVDEDDILELDTLEDFPGTGQLGKLYVDLDTTLTYRWGGSTYVELSSSPGSTDAVPEGVNNKYFTPERALTAVSDALDEKQDSLGYVPVPNTRTVNGKSLSANVSLSINDIGGTGSIGRDVAAANSEADALAALGIEPQGVANPLYTDGIEPISRLIAHESTEIDDAAIIFVHFVAAKTEAVSTFWTGAHNESTQSGSTMCRLGIYSFDGTIYTCLARTANNVARWNVTDDQIHVPSAVIVDNGAASPSAISQVTLTEGQEYAVAFYKAGGTGTPRVMCGYVATFGEPQIARIVDGPGLGVTDLPPTVNIESSWPIWYAPWVRLT